jgi:hypothetical protein
MTTYTSIDDVRGDDHIDSRDLVELRDLMRAELEDIAEDGEQYDGQRDELTEAIGAIDELEEAGIEDWPYGASLIREDTFEDYARELAEDIGAISPNAQWPNTCIDWERAARELAMDYTSVDFLGHSYYVR